MHRSFKGTSVDLPPINLKRGKIKLFKLSNINISSEQCEESSSLTLTWILARHRCMSTKVTQIIPGWSGFHEISAPPDLSPVTVGYLPPIPQSPTDMAVIYAEIERTEQMRMELGLDFIFIEADQAVFTKVIDAMFKMETEGKEVFKTIIPRMGGFHITMCMLKTIFSLFKNCGFVQLLSASGLGGMDTIKKALSGGDVKDVNELNKKLFEATMRYKLEYDNSCIENLRCSENEEQLNSRLDEMANNLDFESVYAAFEYAKETKTIKPIGDMGKLLQIYLDMVDLMLNCIHFLRIWEIVICLFLSYCFRLNRHNYARDLSLYCVHKIVRSRK